MIAAAIATLAYNFLWDNAKSGLSDVDLALGSSAGHGHVRDPVAAAEAKRAREAEEQRIAAERENRLSGEAARIRAELDKAPSLVWDKTFDEWNASAGAVTMNLKWQNDRLPDELNSNRVYFLNIRANGVFSAQLRSSKAIIPVYVRPNENEASRVYLADSADPITWQRDADSDMGGYLANRWGGKLSEDRPPNADPSQASGAPLYSQGRINRGKGPGDLPYSPSLEVPKDMGFEVPFQEPPTDEIRLWELAFIVPAVDATEPFELTIRNVEPLSSIPEPWLCSMGISYKDEELPSYVEKSDLLWDIRCAFKVYCHL